MKNLNKIKEKQEDQLARFNKEYSELQDRYNKLQMAFMETTDRKYYHRRFTNESINHDTYNGMQLEGLILDDIGTEHVVPQIEENTVNMKLTIVKKFKPNQNQQRPIVQSKLPTKIESFVINNETLSKNRSIYFLT